MGQRPIPGAGVRVPAMRTPQTLQEWGGLRPGPEGFHGLRPLLHQVVLDQHPRGVAGVTQRVGPETRQPGAGAVDGGGGGEPAGNGGGESNGVVVALGTESDDCLSRLRAGEAASLVLLSATAMGLASCPITEPLEIVETREEVRTDVFGSDAYPQMLIRLGFAPVDAEPLPATPRHTPKKDAFARG
jgi:hypothetical protein